MTGIVPNPLAPMMGLSMGIGMPSPADRQSRRLYVGNIPAGIQEAEIQDFFNTAMVAAKSVNKPGAPVIAVQINVEKSYAFLELRDPQEATAGMAFDGIMLHGHSLKVRRPKDFVSMPGMPESSGPMPALPAGAIVATNVPDSPFKIFMGGLPAHLSEEQVKELLTAFGPLKAFNLVKDTTTGLSKGFAFCEYLDESVTDRACASLNGMKLGDKQLVVQRASLGAKNVYPATPAPPPMVINGPITATPANILNLAIPAMNLLTALTLPSQANDPSHILMMLNMTTLDELQNEDEYQSLFADVHDECARLGRIITIAVPRDGTCPIAKVYVEFSRTDDAVKAMQSLAGRRYAGFMVVTSMCSQEDFDALPAECKVKSFPGVDVY